MSGMKVLLQLVVIITTFYQAFSQNQNCSIPISQRQTCGRGSESQCTSRGCCYDGEGPPGAPFCFFTGGMAPEFSDWEDWSECSESCGTRGVRRRRRTCLYRGGLDAPDNVCIGRASERESCNRKSCSSGEPNIPEPEATDSSENDNCKDLLGDSCKTYAGFCASLSQLQTYCQKTCKRCKTDNVEGEASTTTTTPVTTEPPTRYPPSECKDEYSTCNRTLEICTDQFYEKYLRKYCRATCNLCEGPRKTDAPCKDVSNQCSKFSSLCDSPVYANVCEYTCTKCQNKTGSTSGPRTVQESVSAMIITTILTTTSPLEIQTTTEKQEPQYCKHIKYMCCQKLYEQNTAPCWKTCSDCPAEETMVGEEEVAETSTTSPSTTTPTPTVAATIAAVDNTDDGCKDNSDLCGGFKNLCGLQVTKNNCRKTCELC